MDSLKLLLFDKKSSIFIKFKLSLQINILNFLSLEIYYRLYSSKSKKKY